jgi:pimeloyl-ACP methyl ester carboxylesterase
MQARHEQASITADSKEGTTTMSDLPNIVLVHGAWADGSTWNAVIGPLQASGYHVTAPQFPMTSLAADVARLRQVLARQDGPTIVAGHSYGGQIMTALGTDAPNVAGLVFIAAFGLDQGESIGALLSQGTPSPPQAERQFAARMGATIVEMPSSHVAMVSHPQDVLALIQAAAQTVQA